MADSIENIRARHERLAGGFRMMPWEDAQALFDEIDRLRARTIPPHVLGDLHCTHGCQHTAEEWAEYYNRPEVKVAIEALKTLPQSGRTQ